MKLIKYLQEIHNDLSNRAIKRALEAGACTINGKIERYASREINPKKDKIVFNKLETKAKARLIIEKTRIIYEDQQILVYDKPSGHAIMSTEKSSEANLDEELKKLYPYIEPVHRLDKQTSGLCLFAKDPKSLKELMRQFKDKEVDKSYEAIVDGNWTLAIEGRIENEMAMARKIGSMQVWQVVAKASHKTKKAITDYKVIKVYKKYSHLELKPVTGRTHQLRVHMAHLGYPIIGDSIYAESFRSGLLYERHLLHAISLEFKQPLTKKTLKLTAPRPKELAELI